MRVDFTPTPPPRLPTDFLSEEDKLILKDLGFAILYGKHIRLRRKISMAHERFWFSCGNNKEQKVKKQL